MKQVVDKVVSGVKLTNDKRSYVIKRSITNCALLVALGTIDQNRRQLPAVSQPVIQLIDRTLYKG